VSSFLRRGPSQARVIENPWIVRTENAEKRFADLRTALTKAIELLPLPEPDSPEELVAYVIEERKGLRGRRTERLEMTLTMSSQGLAVTLNRNIWSLNPYSRQALQAQPAEKIAHVILIEYNKDNAIVGH
jgi:hypothetical protein